MKFYWQILGILVLICIIAFLIAVNHSKARKLKSSIVNDGTTNYIYTKTFAVGYYPVQYRYGITNDGNIRYDVDIGGTLNFETFRYVGTYGQQLDISTLDACDTSKYDWTAVHTSSTLDKKDILLCSLRYIRDQNDLQFISYSLFASCEILATTTEKDDRRTFNLVSTYLGLGILVLPRGSELTENLFYNSFVPLFDDIEYPNCGQNDPNFGLYVDNNPSNLLFKNLYSRFNPEPYSCGRSCFIVYPVPDATSPIIWSLYSNNGAYIMQFRDDGHFIFKYVNASIPIYTTETDILQCTNVLPTEIRTNNVLENIRDRWILKGTSFTYSGGNLSPSTITNQTDIMQILDSGFFYHGKDYLYSSNASHPMVQSSVAKSTNFNDLTKGWWSTYYNVYDKLIPKAMYGIPSFNDINNLHWKTMLNIACSGMDLANKWELGQGIVIDATPIITGTNSARDNKRYILWFGTFGLRLLLCSGTFPKLTEMDWTNCLWISNPYFYALYNWNQYSSTNLAPFGYPTSGTTPPFTFYTTDSLGQPIEYDSTDYTCQTNSINNFPLPRYNLYTCGDFLAPIPQSNSYVIRKLSSPNKRFAFYFMSTGEVNYIDTSIYYTNATLGTLFSSNSYTKC